MSRKRRRSLSDSDSSVSSPGAAAADEFEIESIQEYREDPKAKAFYRVRWAGYGPEDDTWEPTGNILSKSKHVMQQMNRARALYKRTPVAAKSRARRPPLPVRHAANSFQNELVDREVASPLYRARPPSLTTQASAEPPKSSHKETEYSVRHLVARPEGIVAHVCVTERSRDPGGQRTTQSYVTVRSLEDCRRQFPDQLLDYFMQRVQTTRGSPPS